MLISRGTALERVSLKIYLGELDESHVVVEEKILEHLGTAHSGWR